MVLPSLCDALPLPLRSQGEVNISRREEGGRPRFNGIVGGSGASLALPFALSLSLISSPDLALRTRWPRGRCALVSKEKREWAGRDAKGWAGGE